MQIEIQGINCTVENNQWINLLRGAFPENIPRTHYLYVNLTGQLSISPLLLFQGDLLKLRVSNIIAVSRLIFDSYRNCSESDYRTLREIYTKMIPRASNSWCSMFIHWLLGFGFRTTLDILAQELAALDEAGTKNRIFQSLIQKRQAFQVTLNAMEALAQSLCDDRFTDTYRTYLETYNSWATRLANFPQITLTECLQIEADVAIHQHQLNECYNLFARLYDFAQRKVQLSIINLERIENSYTLSDQDCTAIVCGIENDLSQFVDDLFADGILNNTQETTNSLDEFENRLADVEKILGPSRKPSPPSTPASSRPRFTQSPFKSPLHSRTPGSSSRTHRTLNFATTQDNE